MAPVRACVITVRRYRSVDVQRISDVHPDSSTAATAQRTATGTAELVGFIEVTVRKATDALTLRSTATSAVTAAARPRTGSEASAGVCDASEAVGVVVAVRTVRGVSRAIAAAVCK